MPGGGEGHSGQAQGIGHLEVPAADDAEDVPDAELRQGPADELGDGRGRPLRWAAGGLDGRVGGPRRTSGAGAPGETCEATTMDIPSIEYCSGWVTAL